MIVTIILLPLFTMIFPPLYGVIKPYIYIILILAVIYMILRLNRDSYSMAWSTFLLISSGVMGWVMLNTPISTNVSLLTMFSSLFGVSTLIYSITHNSVVPAQDKFHNFKINKNVLRGIFAGNSRQYPRISTWNGTGSGKYYSTRIKWRRRHRKKQRGIFGCNEWSEVSDALFSLIAIYLIGNPRSGIAVYVDKLIQN